MDKYFIGLYCAPAVPAPGHPNRVTPRAYRLLKDAGVDNVFGFFEDRAGEQYLQMALDCAQEAGITFYPRLEVFNRFFGITGAKTKDNLSYWDMPEQMREKLNKEFLQQIDACARHPAFGGVFMGDERGCECFPGIGAAQKLFQKAYPDKGFFYNHLNYFIDDQLFFYCTVPVQGEKKQLTGELTYSEENRFNRYAHFIDLYRQQVDTPYISTDVYPFNPTWKNIPTSIHRCLYEVQSFFADLKCKTGLKPLTYVQVGNWDDESRYIGKETVALHFGIAAAYDFDGFLFFPGCFPNDWLDTPESFAQDGKTGLLDVNGEPTEYYPGVQEIVAHFQQIAGYIHGARWLGVKALGEFDGGFGDVTPEQVEWGHCIYQGGLPENEKHPYEGELPEIQAHKQVFLGVFQDGEQKYLLLVNNTITAQNRVRLPENAAKQILKNGLCRDYAGEEISLDPGESILVIL